MGRGSKNLEVNTLLRLSSGFEDDSIPPDSIKDSGDHRPLDLEAKHMIFLQKTIVLHKC